MNKRDNMTRIAIMGGTFDPIHYGHLVAAEAVRQEFDIDEVRFIPAGSPPHKESRLLAAPWHRYMMTALAAASNKFFVPSSIEIDRGGRSYTIDTVRALREELGESALFFFITGADAVLEILTWKEPDVLLSMCDFVAVTRPGYRREALLDHILKLGSEYNSKIRFLEVPALAISSSDIRARTYLGKSAKYLTPDSVLDYIAKHGLYTLQKDSPEQRRVSDITQYLQLNLSPERFAHTLGVAEQAIRLAQTYDKDIELAHLAGLLHDIAKELPGADMLRLASDNGIAVDEITAASPVLLHGHVGAVLARSKFGVSEQDVLDAMCSHTIGRPNMSMLEKILFVADVLDTGRDAEITEPYQPWRSKIRDLAYTRRNIDAAVYETLSFKRDYTLRKGAKIHPLADDALAFYTP